MLNFTMGTMTGAGLMALALAVGLRQPALLDRLDLMAKPDPTVAVARRSEPACTPKPQAISTPGVARPALLFEPKRFWAVAP